MKAHAKLWINEKGNLVTTPPASGIKIAAYSGDEIPPDFAKRYGLKERGGKVVQSKNKSRKPPANKMKDPPENKGGGLTVKTKRITHSSRKKK